MTSEPIGNETGQITNRRVLRDEAGNFYVEASFESKGELKGVEITNMGTFESRERLDGSVYGEGQGLLTSPDGHSTPWRASGAGTKASDGSIVYHAAVYFQPSGGKFDELARGPTLVEFTVAPDGRISSTIRRAE